MPHGEETADGMYVEGTKVVRPGDADYEKWFKHLAYAHEAYGDPMPYVDEQATGDRRAATEDHQDVDEER